MKKKTFFALLLAAVMLLSGCSLNLKDSTVDAKQTIIDVNGEYVDKQSFLNVYNYYVTIQQYYSQLFGGDGSVDEDSILESTLDNFISSMVLTQKATELGFDQFTDEELAEIQTEAQTEYDEELEYIQTNYFADSELEGDELTAAVTAYAESSGYTLDYFVSSVKSSKTSERLEASVTDSVTITDEDLQAALDEQVASEKETYESTPATYGTRVNAGTTVYYTPAGYRTIRVISVSKPTEEGASSDEAKQQIDALYERLVAGEAFETLSEDVKTYAICSESTTPEADVVTAAMQLTDALSYTEVLETEKAFYIVQLVEELAEHTATLEEARATLYDSTLESAKEAAYEAAQQAWIDAADVKTYTERLSD